MSRRETAALVRGIGAFLADNAEEVALYVEQALKDEPEAAAAPGEATAELPRVREQRDVLPFPHPDGTRVGMSFFAAMSLNPTTVHGTVRRLTLAEATEAAIPDACLGYAVEYISPPRSGGLPLRKGETLDKAVLKWDGRAFKPMYDEQGMVYRVEVWPLDS